MKSRTMSLWVCVGIVSSLLPHAFAEDTPPYTAHAKQIDGEMVQGQPCRIEIFITDKLSVSLPNQEGFTLQDKQPAMEFDSFQDQFMSVGKTQVQVVPDKIGDQQLGPFVVSFRGHPLTTDVIRVSVLPADIENRLVVLEPGTRELSVGDTLTLQLFVTKNEGSEAPTPKIHVPSGFSEPSQKGMQATVSFINGVENRRYRYTYETTAQKTGTFPFDTSTVEIPEIYFELEPFSVVVKD